MTGFFIRQHADQTAPYVDTVRRISDENVKALGFLRASVFARYAQEEKLIVATCAGTGAYVGHLLYDCSFPRAAVRQIFCLSEWRGRGVASAMLEHLEASLSATDFLSIRARVAEDLVESNAFWERANFYVARREKGGATTGRMILVRVRELDTPQLFAKSQTSLHPSNKLGLVPRGALAAPTYFVDLNIVFDVVHKRVHVKEAENLLHASHVGECRVLISEEMLRELERNAPEDGNDPMIRMIGSLPRVPLPKDGNRKPLEEQVARFLFPEKSFPEGLSRNDRSDVMHVVTAMVCNATAFVTRDARILDAASSLYERFGLRVISAEQLWALSSDEDSTRRAEVRRGRFVEFKASADDRAQLRQLLEGCGIEPIDLTTLWLPHGRSETQTAVHSEGEIVGVCSWGPVDQGCKTRVLRVAIKQSTRDADAIARTVMQACCQQALRDGLVRVELEIPRNQAATVEAAYRAGFRRVGDQGRVAKIFFNEIVEPSQWHESRMQLRERCGLALPSVAPRWDSSDQLFDLRCPDGERRHLSLGELESLLSPVIFGLEGRPAVLASIRPKYSRPLLGDFRQLSLAPRVEASTYAERLFLCAPRLLSRFTRGGLIFFYESQAKGEQAVIAVARVVECYLIRRDDLGEESLRNSVLEASTVTEIGVSKDKAACLFDNLVMFSKPVSLQVLDRVLDIKPARLVSVSRLTQQQASEILRLAR